VSTVVAVVVVPVTSGLARCQARPQRLALIGPVAPARAMAPIGVRAQARLVARTRLWVRAALTTQARSPHAPQLSARPPVRAACWTQARRCGVMPEAPQQWLPAQL